MDISKQKSWSVVVTWGGEGMARREGTVTIFVLIGLALLVLVAVGPVVAPLPIPMRTQGRAFDPLGRPLPSGTPIRTFVDGVNYSNGPVVQDAIGSFVVLTYGNSKTNPNVSDTPTIQEGANLGDSIIYAAGDFTTTTGVFQESFPWSPGNITTHDLHLGSVFSTPLPLKVKGIVTQPARGGNQYVFVCNPTGRSASLADYYLERDRPGTYHGGSIDLSGVLAAGSSVRFNLTSPSWLIPTGDALKLVYRNPGGGSSTAGGRDLVVDRVEFNATRNGTLYWEPGNTIMGDAPAPEPGRILQRDASCADTNDPRDFTLATEPGLPAGQPPEVSITIPAPGQRIPAGSSVTFSWTMSDNVFLSDYLHAWANVTIGTQVIRLVSDGIGVRSVTWTTPNMAATDVGLRIDVMDPFGAHGSATRTFSLTPQSPVALIVAALIAVVLLAFLVFAFLRSRKRKQGPPSTPPAQPTPPASPPPIGAPVFTQAKKVCPRCHTAVKAEDQTCFFCGYKFPDQNAPPP
jgi:hypothetical protein